MKNISATSLARAAVLAASIENLNTKLTDARASVTALETELQPVQSEYNEIMGTPPRKYTRADGSTGRFTDEQRAKISAGLKAKWAERKAAKAAPATSAPADETSPAN